MPLPDAIKKSPRVYTLLQNLDLENLTADNLADVGDPIAIEEANEDELRRLCLVAFARMVTKGSFDGWLSSAEGVGAVIPKANIGTSYTRHVVTHYPLTGNSTAANSTIAQTNSPVSRPFIAPQTGDIAEIGVVVAGAGAVNTMRVGIFSDSDMAPHLLLGYVDVDTSSAGSIYQTSFSSTVATTRGTVYHCMWVRTASGTNPSLTAESNAGLAWIAASSSVSSAPNQQACLVLSGSDNDLEATVTKTNLSPTYNDPLRISLKYA